MVPRPRRTVLLLSPLAFCFVLSACALDAPERRQPRRDWPPPDGLERYPEQPVAPPGEFEVGCRFGISGCEAEAAARCGYAGFHVLGTYRTRSARGWPYFYMRAACGPVPWGITASQAAPNAQEEPAAPSRDLDQRGRALPPGAFEVSCRFETSGCEREAWERCGSVGYHVLGSYSTREAAGAPNFHLMAACGAAPKANPWASASVAWDVVRLEMPPTSLPVDASTAGGKRKVETDPFDRPGAPNAELVASIEAMAKSGKAEAQARLGAMYAAGDGVPKDFAKAAEWYRKAVEQGDASAQNNLAMLYENGEAVPNDMAEAARLYRMAAEQGAAIAQYNLAVLCRIGLGVPKDGEQAAGWAKKAAMQGQANAQALLGALYARGEGVPHDEVLAYAWLNLAAAQGLEPAAKARDEMLLPPQDLTEAQRLSSAWKQGQLLQRQSTEKKGRPRSGR